MEQLVVAIRTQTVITELGWGLYVDNYLGRDRVQVMPNRLILLKRYLARIVTSQGEVPANKSSSYCACVLHQTRVCESGTPIPQDVCGISTESLKYHGSGTQLEVSPFVGTWNMNILKMFSGGTMNYWAVVNFLSQRPQAVDQFVYGIISMCKARGMVF
ncbi:argonaute family protein [Artemisia annua]|uniref:Argonaute family protein n=1 Tax=Artemisia annua TaxID=35608 RepID=A0A2U1PUM7_ARTAN|nr:argonaute family protein [Artemisia annua]